MQEKTITITIDERGNSTLDLEGFASHGCEKAFDGRGYGESGAEEARLLHRPRGQAREEPALKEA